MKQILTGQIKNGILKIQDKLTYVELLRELEGKEVDVIISKIFNQRSNEQNKSLHKLFDLVSKDCEKNGVTVNMIIEALNKKGFDIITTPQFIKELWRMFQIVALEKHSTTELEKLDDIEKVYEPFSRFVGENWRISIPFPSTENKIKEDAKSKD